MDNYSQKGCEPIGEVNFGKVQWYSKPRNKDTMVGSVISYIDGSEARFDERTVVNCNRKIALREGDAIVYSTTGDGKRANLVFDLRYLALADQIDSYWMMLVKLAERLNDPGYTGAVRNCKKMVESEKKLARGCVVVLMKYLREKAELSNIGNVNIGKILFYNYSYKYDSVFGYVKPYVNGKEMRVEPNALRNCNELKEGSFVIYEEGEGKNANHVFDLSRSASDDQIDSYWMMLVKLAERLNASGYTGEVRLAKANIINLTKRVEYLREYLLRKAELFNIGNVNIGKIRYYNYSYKYDSVFGYVKPYVNGKEMRVEPNALYNCNNLEEGSSVIYEEGKGKNAYHVFDLSRSAFDDEIDRYWMMLVKLGKRLNDFDYTRTLQFVKKYFDTFTDRVDYVREFLLIKLFNSWKEPPIGRLPENFLTNSPEYFDLATNKQRLYLYQNDKKLFAESLNSVDLIKVDMKKIAEALPEDFLINFPVLFAYATPEQCAYLYKNDQELFAKSLKYAENPEVSGSADMKKIAEALPDDFLINFPEYFSEAAEKQLLYYLEKDEQGFLTEIEKLSESQKKTVVPQMSEDFAVKYPQYAAYASDNQLQFIARKQERERIYKWSQARGIEYLVHFTHISNLKSILEKGLLTRANLKSSNTKYFYTDSQRLDGVTNSISLSVSFPNCNMFYAKKKEWTNGHNMPWCVLLLKTEILRDIDCAFNKGNAALNSNRRTKLIERETLEKFVDLFADYGERSKLKKPSAVYATDPQSEILCLGNIPLKYISACCFYGSDSLDDVLHMDPNIKLMLDKHGIKGYYNNEWYFGRGPYEDYLSNKERNADNY